MKEISYQAGHVYRDIIQEIINKIPRKRSVRLLPVCLAFWPSRMGGSFW